MTLPEGWVETTLGEIVAFNPKHDPACNLDQLVSFVPMPSVDEHSGTITSPAVRPLREIWSGFTHFAEGDVIFAKITPCMENGKAAVAKNLKNGIACGSTEFFVLRPLTGVQARYIWRYLRQSSFRETAENKMTGAVGQRRVPKPYLESYVFRLPPEAEQRRIVAKLDTLMARIAAARAEVDRVQLLTSRFRKKARGSALINEGRSFRLSEITPTDAPIIYGILQPGPNVNGGVAYVRPTEISKGVIQVEQVRRTTPEIAAHYKRSTIRAGDLILTIVGTIGKVAEVPASLEGGNITQSSCRIRVNPQIANPGYIRHWLQSPQAWVHYDAGRLGTAVPRLNLRDIRDFTIILPDIATQARAAAALDAAFARADRLEAEAARARALLDRLEAAILAKAFRGELVPQDPTDEPASVLLDRIRAERAAAPKAKRGRARKALG